MENRSAEILILQDKQRLNVLKQSGLLDSPPEAAFDRLTRIAAYSLNVPIALVSLVDDTRQFFKSQIGLPDPVASIRQTPLTHSFCQHVVITEKKLVITDARRDPLVQNNQAISDLGVIAYAGFPLITHDGEVIGSFCAIDNKPREWSAEDLKLLEDLAAVVMSEISLKRAKETAEAANRAKDRFLAMLSHELRTPLSPALLISAAMAGDSSLPTAAREDARMIQRNVQQQSRLIDDLLDLTRIENGKVSLQFASCDLHELLTEVVTHFQTDAAAKGLTLTYSLVASRHKLEADAARLRQVFSNLLRNAIKFTPQSGRIEVETKDGPDATVEISITDNGIGIDAQVLPKIFDAFEQGSRSITDEFSGLGLGLAITRGLVDAHSGKICAFSGGKDCGCRMTVMLPAAAAVTDTPVLTPAVAAALDHSFSILLVEDHKDTLRAMSRLLRTLDHRVTAVGCMTDALAAAETDRFDLLISDLDLPDGTGLDLMRRVALKQPIRGIALTGYGMEEDLEKSRSAGFDAHLVKPINFKDLALAIQQTSRI